MQTGTDHIAITNREFEKENVSLGRVKNNESRVPDEFRYSSGQN